MLRHADTSVCSPVVHDPSHHPPPTLRQLSAPPHTASISFSSAYPSTCCAPNCRSNPIAHRVRRKHQRLPPSLLIENASERFPLPTPSVVPRRFRSRLATTHPECKRIEREPQKELSAGRSRRARNSRPPSDRVCRNNEPNIGVKEDRSAALNDAPCPDGRRSSSVAVPSQPIFPRR